MNRVLRSVLILLTLSLGLESHSLGAEPPPVRGVWVANVGSETLQSPASIREFVELADRVGVNTLYVVVWNRGYTVYPSAIMQREFNVSCDPRYEGFDVLKEFVTAGHAKKMRVIAWFEFGFAASNGDPTGGPILRARPEWAARDIHGQIATMNDFQWMNAFHPDVQNFVLALLKEILMNYEVDGVQGDDRLPACPTVAGYDSWTVDTYRQQHEGQAPPKDPLDPGWIEWRANLLNQFMERMHRELKHFSPTCIISSAPSVFPWSKRNYLQDWPTWVARGWVDEVCPQIYRKDVPSYQAELEKILTKQVSKSNHAKIFPGVLVRTGGQLHNDRAVFLGMVAANRAADLDGEVIFYDEAVRQHPKWFEAAW
jgi:uncharacterized lipoprotein YddW (UPF0748 family)